MVYNNDLYMRCINTLSWIMSIVVFVMVFVIYAELVKDDSSDKDKDNHSGPTGPAGTYESWFKKITN